MVIRGSYGPFNMFHIQLLPKPKNHIEPDPLNLRYRSDIYRSESDQNFDYQILALD